MLRIWLGKRQGLFGVDVWSARRATVVEGECLQICVTASFPSCCHRKIIPFSAKFVFEMSTDWSGCLYFNDKICGFSLWWSMRLIYGSFGLRTCSNTKKYKDFSDIRIFGHTFCRWCGQIIVLKYTWQFFTTIQWHWT